VNEEAMAHWGLSRPKRNWVYTQWQWSVDLYKNRKETAIYKSRNSIEKIKKNTEYTKWKTKIQNKQQT